MKKPKNLKNNLNLFVFGLLLFFFILLFKFVPSLAATVEKLAIFSTRLNATKQENLISCLKQFKNLKKNTTQSFNQNSLKTKELKQAQNLKDKEQTNQIIRKQYEPLNSKKFVNLGNFAYVYNMTKLSNDVVLNANKRAPYFKLENTKNPQVLIYHTHTTECYEKEEANFYDKNKPTRSKDSKLNVVGVGQQIKKQLELRGINVIHETKIYDEPAYTGAYDRTNAMILNTLKKNPQIKVVLDIHRDAITNEKKQRIAPTTTINGQKVAQVMIISGCDNGTNHYKNFEKNLSFACALQKQLETDFPKITRPISFKYKHYNQSLSTGALLVEIGSQANSAKEANLAGTYFGVSLANILLKQQNKTKS